MYRMKSMYDVEVGHRVFFFPEVSTIFDALRRPGTGVRSRCGVIHSREYGKVWVEFEGATAPILCDPTVLVYFEK